MKIYIQSNKYQSLAAKVSKYSFERFGFKTEIMEFEKNNFLKAYVGKTFLRRKKIIEYEDDLQSFTFLRFYAPELDGYKNKILVIDPDIFAVSDPNQELENLKKLDYDILCTFTKNNPRTEMMMINCEKVRWNFQEILNDIFQKKLDYDDLIKLKFYDKKKN